MGYLARFVLLIGLALQLQASESLKPGDMVPDFTLPATNGFGQRLEEARGSYLMLIWLGDCDECSERLVRYQLLAESLEIEGLKGWFVWTPKGKRQPPNMRIPVLKYQPKWRQGWMFEERPVTFQSRPWAGPETLRRGDRKKQMKKNH